MNLFGPHRMRAPRPRTPIRPIGFLQSIKSLLDIQIEDKDKNEQTEVYLIQHQLNRQLAFSRLALLSKSFDRRSSVNYCLWIIFLFAKNQTFSPSANSNSTTSFHLYKDA
jgi:hypothetical protein